MSTTYTPTTDPAVIRARLGDIIPRGLSRGVGSRDGAVCVEAAIAWAEGGPHSDAPACVAPEDRAFWMRLNDAPWASDEARAAAMLPPALAQVGTAGSDRSAWVARVVEGTIRRVLPLALRVAADAHHDGRHRDALREAADRCEREGTREAAVAAYAAADAADAAYAARAAAGAHTLTTAVEVGMDAYRAEGRA